MKYLVVESLDGEDKVLNRHDAYDGAYVELLDRFLDYQKSCGYSEKDSEDLYTMIEAGGDLERDDCGIIVDGYPCFWSDSDPVHKYDIKIVDQ